MKILCILDDDSKNEIPVRFAKGDIPKLENYPDGMLPPREPSTLLVVNSFSY
jgi:hypothetical protein